MAGLQPGADADIRCFRSPCDVGGDPVARVGLLLHHAVLWLLLETGRTRRAGHADKNRILLKPVKNPGLIKKGPKKPVLIKKKPKKYRFNKKNAEKPRFNK
jgi:hypothetical protein